VRQIRRSYSANNFTYVVDFSAARTPHILKGGIFEGCVLSPSNWKDFTSRKKSSANNHIANKQYMLRRRGNDKMVLEHNFDYQSDEIQKVFNNLISNILHEKSSDNDEICESYSGYGKPIIVKGNAYETGLSILADSGLFPSHESHINRSISRMLMKDPSLLAWNRAQAAHGFLSSKARQEGETHENPEFWDVVIIFIEILVGVGFTTLAYRSALSIRPYDDNYLDPSNNSWEILRNQADTDYSDEAYKKSYEIIYELGGAVAAFITSYKEISESKLWNRTTFLVSQGGLVTYTYPFQEQNGIEGSEFFVSHWYNVKVLSEGHWQVNVIVYGIFHLCILIFFVWCYYFSLTCQAKMHLPFIQGCFKLIYWPIQILQTLIARILPQHWAFISSYEKLFRRTCDKLCDKYHKVHLEPPAAPRILGRYELSTIVRKDGHLFRFPWYGSSDNAVSRNEIEKAAEILAASCHGRLCYFQSMAVLCDYSLTESVEKFRRDNCCELSVLEIKRLSMVYYVKGVIVPSRAPHGFPLERFRQIESKEGLNTLERNEKAALAPIFYGNNVNKYAVLESLS